MDIPRPPKHRPAIDVEPGGNGEPPADNNGLLGPCSRISVSLLVSSVPSVQGADNAEQQRNDAIPCTRRAIRAGIFNFELCKKRAMKPISNDVADASDRTNVLIWRMLLKRVTCSENPAYRLPVILSITCRQFWQSCAITVTRSLDLCSLFWLSIRLDKRLLLGAAAGGQLYLPNSYCLTNSP